MTSRQYNALIKDGSDDFRKLQAKAAERQYGKLPDLLGNGMNKTEARYADFLQLAMLTGGIHGYEWTGKNKAKAFKIGKRRHYKADFHVHVTPERMEVVEIKGYLRDGGSIRFDLAAEANPGLVFRMIRWDRKHREWVEIRTRNVPASPDAANAGTSAVPAPTSATPDASACEPGAKAGKGNRDNTTC
jgi:hypothetical protein